MLRIATLASAAALLGMAAPALAQTTGDAWTWTGPYVGVNAGYAGGGFHYPFSGSTDSAGTDPVTGKLRQSSSGALGGVQAGYNVETPSGFVVGLETDIDAADIQGRSGFYGSDSAGTTASGSLASKIDYLGTVRGRVGKAMFGGRFLPYVTGGFAYGGVKTSAGVSCASCAEAGGFYDNTHTQTGWTVGAGAEYALDRHLSFKVEYLYADLGSRDLSSDVGAVNVPTLGLYNADLQEKADANIIRAGVNFRF